LKVVEGHWLHVALVTPGLYQPNWHTVQGLVLFSLPKPAMQAAGAKQQQQQQHGAGVSLVHILLGSRL
jgi:hypothetical protein